MQNPSNFRPARRRAARSALLASIVVSVIAPAIASADDYPVAPFNGPFASASFHRVAGAGVSAVPGMSGLTFDGTTLAGVLGHDTAFVGTYTDPTANASRSGLFAGRGDGSIDLLAGPGTVTPGGETIRSIVGNGEWIDGQITFAANTSSGQALYRLNTTSKMLTKLVSAGEVVASSESPIVSFGAKGVAGDQQGYGFSAVLADGTDVLYQSTGPSAGSSLVVADDKTRSPVPETGLYVDFPEIAYRSGMTAFIPRGLETDQPGGVAGPVGVFLATPGNPTRLAAFKNGAIPGTPDDEYRFNEFEKPRLFDHQGERTLGFTGGFIEEEDPTSDEHFMGVFTVADGGWKNWINSDIELPGLRADVEEFNGFGIDGGFFAAGAVDEDGGRYIFAEIDGRFEYVLSTYDMLDGKAISAIRWTTDVMDGAQLHFTAQFTDGTNGVYAVNVPEPASLATVALAGLASLRRRRASRV